MRVQMMTAENLAMVIRRPTVVFQLDDMGVDAILRQGGVLMAATEYNPRPEPEHDSGYLKVDKGCPVKIYGGCEEPGNSDNVYGKYAYAELYSPAEEQLIPRQDGTYPCRGWVPTDVLALPTPGWCRHHRDHPGNDKYMHTYIALDGPRVSWWQCPAGGKAPFFGIAQQVTLPRRWQCPAGVKPDGAPVSASV